MADLKLLQEDLEQTITRRNELRAKYTGTVIPAEARTEDEQLAARAEGLVELIETEKQKERDAKFADVSKYFSDPQYQINHPVNADDGGKKVLEGKGWKIADGWISRETSEGEQKMYPEGVVFGAIPNDPAAAEYFKITRAAFQPDYRDSYLKYIVAMAKTKDSALALMALSGAEQKALSEGQDSAGGFLVPPDIQAEIFARTAQQAVMRSLCRVVNTSRDRIMWPRVSPHATSGSIYSSAFVGTWSTETPTASDTDPAFGTVEISIKKIRVSTRMSNDFISDAIANIPAFLATDGGRNMALVEDNGLLNGQSLGNPALEPMGLLQDSDVSTTSVEGTTTDTISNTISDAGSAPKLITLGYAIPSQYVAGATWLMRRASEGKIRGLVDGGGRFLWPPMIASGFANVVRELLGSPVQNSDFMPAEGTNANKVLAYGDFSHYVIAQRAQITTTLLRERYADTDQTGIILWERLGGALTNPDAFRFGIV